MTVIRKRAERHERKRMQNYKVQAERLSAFEELLNEIYTVCRPKPRDYEVRRDLISAFNEIAKDIYGNLCTKTFYSTIQQMDPLNWLIVAMLINLIKNNSA